MEASDPSERLICDFEFVQNLANIGYLQYLAVNKYFAQETFMNYLKYLRYWKEPEYSRMLVFPQCLAFLDALIDNEQFRQELVLGNFVEFVHQQQGAHWLAGSAQIASKSP